jgi:c-di-GMP-binding flagellar brake protein YcgR
MPFLRNHPRTTDTQDLSIRLRPAGRTQPQRRVLNLSEGGMLIAGGRFEVGSTMPFELAAGDLHAAGLAQVEHSTGGTTGLRFVRWDPSGDREIQELIHERIRNQRHEEAAHTVPGGYLG